MMGFSRMMNGRKKPQHLDLRKKAIRIPETYETSTPPTSPGGLAGLPGTPASPATRDFNILAALQMSIKGIGDNNSFGAYNCPPNTPASGEFPGDILDGSQNALDLRKQGRLCLTFALKHYTEIAASDKIKLANDLEDAIDRAYLGTDYRGRIYTVGGILSDSPGIVKLLIKGDIAVDEVAVAKTMVHPITPATPSFRRSDLQPPTPSTPKFGPDISPISPTVIWSQEVPNSPKFKPE